jgi:hypothetical protein
VTYSMASRGGKYFWLTPFLPVIMALACVLLWGSMYSRIADRNIGIDKDWLLIYLCGVETVHPGLHEQQTEMVKDIVLASGDDNVIYRATLRANYCDNYPFTSLSMYLAGQWQQHFGVSAAKDFAGFLSRSLWYGVVVSGELLGILCLLVAFFVTRGAVRLSLFITIGVCALYYLLIPPPMMTWMFYQLTPTPPAKLVNWIHILGLGLHSWFNPGAAYSPFSAFARCLCAMLAFTTFALRWADRRAAAYWMPLLVSGVHQSSAIILLFALVCCDIVIRPQVFRRINYLMPIAANLLVILLRERMLAIMGFSLSQLLLVAAILLVLGLVIVMLRPVRESLRPAWLYIAEWRARTIQAVPLPFADALVLFAAWFVLLLICYFASRNDPWFRVIYFWSEVSPRYVGMFQLSVGAGLIYPLVAMLRSARPAAERVTVVCIAVLMLAGAAAQFRVELTGIASGTKGARRYEASSLRTDVYAETKPGTGDETTWYYLLLRSAFLGDRSISTFFGRRAFELDKPDPERR